MSPKAAASRHKPTGNYTSKPYRMTERAGAAVAAIQAKAEACGLGWSKTSMPVSMDCSRIVEHALLVVCKLEGIDVPQAT